MVTEQLHEGWWEHDDTSQPVAPAHGFVGASGRPDMTPVPVPELVFDVPGGRIVPPAGSARGDAAWRDDVDTSFAHGTGPAPTTVVRPLRTQRPPIPVPELVVESVTPWPAPLTGGGTARSASGWWFAADGRWHPPVAAGAAAGTASGATSTGGGRRGRRIATVTAALAAVAAVSVLASVGFHTSVGPSRPTTHRAAGTGAPPSTAPTTVPTTSLPPGAPAAAVPATTVPPGTSTAPTSVPGPTATTPVTDPPAPAPAPPPPAPQSSSGVVYQYESGTTPTSVAALAADPAATAGKGVAFTGVITQFAVDSTGGATAMYVSDPGAPTPVVLVQISVYDDPTQLNIGDTVVIWGDAAGDVDFENTVGEPTDVSEVEEVYLSDRTSGYQDTADPDPG